MLGSQRLILVEKTGKVTEDARPLQLPEQRLAGDACGFRLGAELLADPGKAGPLVIAPGLCRCGARRLLADEGL